MKERILIAAMVFVMSAFVGLTTYSGYVYDRTTTFMTPEQFFSEPPRSPVDFMVWAFKVIPNYDGFIPVSEVK